MLLLQSFIIGLRFKAPGLVFKAAFHARPFVRKTQEAICRVSTLTFIALFFAMSPANSTLTINPVSLEFSHLVAVQEITMENQSNETKAFEISLKKWQQDKGEDIYLDTNDVIVFPLTTKIPPHSKQKFRLILKNLPDESKQIAYRLFFTERSYQTRSKAQDSMITFLLNMTVPVFVTGKKYKDVESANWSVEVLKKDNSMVLSLANNGSKFLKIRNISAKEVPSFKSGDWQYILAGTTRSWTMPLMKNSTAKALTISYASVESLEESIKSVSIPIASVKSASKTSAPEKESTTKVASKKP